MIISHNEFGVLQRLVDAIDDPRNDIYIHFDKKVDVVPGIVVKNSRLFVCEERLDVRWGDISMLKVEYALWESAYARGGYLYYHIISGVHFPLKSQNDFHRFFDKLDGMSVLEEMETSYREIDSKIKKYNLFISTFVSTNKFVSKCRYCRLGYESSSRALARYLREYG